MHPEVRSSAPRRALSWIIVFAAGAAAGFLFVHDRDLTETALPQTPVRAAPAAAPVTKRLDGYAYTRPLVACEPAREGSSSLGHVRASLQAVVTDLRERRRVIDASIYLRDLEGGDWISIGGDQLYAPASLTKAVWLVAAIKADELTPKFLDQAVPAPTEWEEDSSQVFQPRRLYEPGEMLPLSRLVEAMVTESDNAALRVVERMVGRPLGRAVFQDLGLFAFAGPEVQLRDRTDVVSPRMMGRVFNALYDATYLAADSANMALGVMKGSAFRRGLVAGVPPEVVVAHKFAQWHKGGREAPEQLHDCGIVYVPGRPYSICVMTRGKSPVALVEAIATLSRTAYEGMLLRPAPRAVASVDLGPVRPRDAGAR